MTFTETITLVKCECTCGGVFAISERFRENARRNGKGYTCPYCNSYWSWKESEADKLRKQLEEKERALVAAKCETTRANLLLDTARREQERAAKKLRRIEKGVCPCCNRSFTNLRRHMESKHPEATAK